MRNSLSSASDHETVALYSIGEISSLAWHDGHRLLDHLAQCGDAAAAGASVPRTPPREAPPPRREHAAQASSARRAAPMTAVFNKAPLLELNAYLVLLESPVLQAQGHARGHVVDDHETPRVARRNDVTVIQSAAE